MADKHLTLIAALQSRAGQMIFAEKLAHFFGISYYRACSSIALQHCKHYERFRKGEMHVMIAVI